MMQVNSIGNCKKYDVVINIKRGSFPAVNPDGYSFPKDFIDPSKREPIHTIELSSEGKPWTYTISNPKPGNWYALAYVKWEDPRKRDLEQEGLTADCDLVVYADLQVKEEIVETIDCYSGITINYADIPANFKCLTLDNPNPIGLNLTVLNTTKSHYIRLRAQALSLPTEQDYLVSCAFDPKLSNSQTITFRPNLKSWHYVVIDNIQNTSKYADCELYYRSDKEEASNHTVIDLMRDEIGRFFSFDYGLPTVSIQDATTLVNLSSNEITSVRFEVNEIIDIGGNLAIEARLLMSWKYMRYRRQKKKVALLNSNDDELFQKVVICMDIDHASIPLETGHCKYNDKVKPALFVLNSMDAEPIYVKTIIPYPDSGNWYLTLRLFCDEINRTLNDTVNTVDQNISEAVKNNASEGGTIYNATVGLTIASTSCVYGNCSNEGKCLLNSYGGLVMSFCSCSSGYGGWDCSDDSRMGSNLLSAVLLLTLSNLLFIVSIYVAIIRLYYTEATMYVFTMVTSTFYHACDAPAPVSLCILEDRVILQFGDFYCGIMSFWVTLLAMSIISERFRSLLQLVGAIVISILTFWNMYSITSFMVSVGGGFVVLGSSWYYDYRKRRKMMYPKSYYYKYLPLGSVLILIGLLCYGFLQTESNYKIIHSLWHCVVAFSVAFLLPDIRREGQSSAFLPSPNWCKPPFCTFCDGSNVPITSEMPESDLYVAENSKGYHQS